MKGHYTCTYLTKRGSKEALLTDIVVRGVPLADVELCAGEGGVGNSAVVAHGSDNHFSHCLANFTISCLSKLNRNNQERWGNS